MRGKIFILVLLTVIAVAAAGDVAIALTTYVADENMYVAASVLVKQGAGLYHDFAYLQTPYLPLLCGGLFWMFGVGTHYYLWGKLINLAFFFIAAGLLYAIARRISGSTVAALCLVVLYLLNSTLIEAAAFFANNIPPLALVLGSFYLFIRSGVAGRLQPRGLAGSGVLLALGVGMKLTYASLIPAYLIAMVGYYGIFQKNEFSPSLVLRRILLPFCAGMAVGLAPMLIYLRDFNLFYFDNFRFHLLTGQYRIASHFGATSPAQKALYARSVYFENEENALLIAAIGCLAMASREKFKRWRDFLVNMGPGFMLALLIFLFGAATAVTPTPSFPQYFAMPVMGLLLLAVYALSVLSPEGLKRNTSILLVFVVVASMSAIPNGIKALFSLSKAASAYPVMAWNVSREIGDRLKAHGFPPGKIATVTPLFALEAGLPTYPELTTGRFMLRLQGLLPDAQFEHYKDVAPGNLGNLFTQDPPSAVFSGFETEWDPLFEKYALDHNYVLDAGFSGPGKLYLRQNATP